jgi:hypothetical protein
MQLYAVLKKGGVTEADVDRAAGRIYRSLPIFFADMF